MVISLSLSGYCCCCYYITFIIIIIIIVIMDTFYRCYIVICWLFHSFVLFLHSKILSGKKYVFFPPIFSLALDSRFFFLFFCTSRSDLAWMMMTIWNAHTQHTHAIDFRQKKKNKSPYDQMCVFRFLFFLCFGNINSRYNDDNFYFHIWTRYLVHINNRNQKHIYEKKHVPNVTHTHTEHMSTIFFLPLMNTMWWSNLNRNCHSINPRTKMWRRKIIMLFCSQFVGCWRCVCVCVSYYISGYFVSKK